MSVANAPRIFGIPILLNLPAFAIVMAITCCSTAASRKCPREQHHGGVNCLSSGLVGVGAVFTLIGKLQTVRALTDGRGIHQGAAIIFFAYIGFDAISTAVRDKNPQREHADRHSRGTGDLHLDLVIVGAVATGSCLPATGRRPIRFHARSSWPISKRELDCRIWRCRSLTAVLLVFQYGQPRILFAMAVMDAAALAARSIRAPTPPHHHGRSLGSA